MAAWGLGGSFRGLVLPPPGFVVGWHPPPPATRHVCHAFSATWDGPVTHQPAEVAWGGWMSPAELRAWLSKPDWPFVPDGRQLVETLLADGGL